MAGSDWGQGWASAADATIFQLLYAYATQGGHLFGARRSADNPLRLTHVRWQGPGDVVLGAIHSPDAGESGSAEEREVWVQLALHLPPTPPRQMGPESPWLPLPVDQQQAMAWARMDHPAQTNWPPHRAAPGTRGYTGPHPRPPQATPSSGWGPPGVSAPPPMQRTPGFSTSEPLPPRGGATPLSPRPGSSPSPYSMPPNAGADAGQWTESGRRGEMMEVVVLPCVEVELPPLMSGGATADYRHDFSRDVAMHFGRAARTIQQVRDVRGWMRGDRLVLAACFVVGIGGRAPTRPEMDGAARALADVLARRTIPYATLGFADPSEWMQGAPLPE